MYQNPKSATTAGLLGIFLGAFGAHNWYLGEKGKGIAHVCMMSGGILLEIIAAAILPNVLSFSMLLNIAWLLGILAPIALAAMSASGIWGLVEGIIILSQGDAGLARKGYMVADPMVAQGYGGQPINGGYNQMNNGFGPMNNMSNMNNGQMNQANGMNGMNGMSGMNNMGNMNNNMNGMGGMNGNMNNMNNMNNAGNQGNTPNPFDGANSGVNNQNFDNQQNQNGDNSNQGGNNEQ